MKPRRRLSATALVIAVLASVWYCNGEASEEGRWVLELKSLSANPLVIRIPVRVGDFVRLRFIHSWDRISIQETTVVTAEGVLLLKEAEFPELAVGYDTPPVSGDYRLEHGNIHITDMDVPLKKIPLRIGTVAHHQLVVGEKVLDLAELFGKGVRIDIQLKPRMSSED